MRLHRDWQARGQEHAGILLSTQLTPGELLGRLNRAARLLTHEIARNQLMRLSLFALDESAESFVASLALRP